MFHNFTDGSMFAAGVLRLNVMNLFSWIKVIPFSLLIVLIAFAPVLCEGFWQKNYAKISFSLAILVCLTYFFFGSYIKVVHSLVEYIQFISILLALYITSSGIHLNLNVKDSPLVNAICLFFGALIANIIGTMGASMLLIRPFLTINKNRISKYHIVFFIFVVSNIGGALTPIGDPPLLLGFMKGVPFFWAIKRVFFIWLSALLLLISIFYAIDKYHFEKLNKLDKKIKKENTSPTFSITGKRNFIWLAIIIAVIFLDPSIVKFVPVLKLAGHSFSVVRELILLIVSVVVLKNSNKTALKNNNFTLEPIEEIAILFVGIFFTMIPVIDIVSGYFKSDVGRNLITPSFLYWTTGSLSSFLDNAPTYINFLAASMSSKNLNIQSVKEVAVFANGLIDELTISYLKSISVSSVFFGAMTYIGNGPNLMVKSIANKYGAKTPFFFEYIYKFSITILLPVLLIIWFIYIK